ncbi:High-affnity carbon uptake protein Hat/HatR [Alloactinosynnema sp. L-07]|uniref:WD40 repeat domain-containing protein n=1 Tax=Alloactinosynnema sp. L-07 TaxID=1653480 RepID=UPI00065EF9AC|nr:WD40 repeat domain-containing protein [Alloactinosynnema sp. L-07]CRK58198.1 High-affnity carbon uptake protein Hat/HatR [Alloactinosynnema sp. L-07]
MGSRAENSPHLSAKPDPTEVSTRDDLARELTTLRHLARRSLRDLGKAANVPFGTLGGWFRGASLPQPAQVDAFESVLAECGVLDAAERELWLSALTRVRRLPVRRALDGATPYRGLEAFQVEHAGWFFGREELTEHLLARLDQARTPVVVVGPSGSGKSSALRAGVLAELTSRGTTWSLCTPGAHPMSRLPDSPGSVVVIDQFEEVFTSCADESERSRFLDAVFALRATVVIGLRADFYPDALRDPRLAEALQANQVVVGPMCAADLRRAVIEPARKAHCDVDNALVDLVLREIGPASVDRAHNAGALPLLSHALLTTWEHRGGDARMSAEAYRQAGGLDGAVARTAETVYAELDHADRERARRLLLRLVHIGDGVADTRRRVEHSELADDTEDVLYRFVEARLLTAYADAVEISHEALLTAWPRLGEWLDADRAGLRIHRHLTEAARAWDEGDRDPGGLLRTGRLAIAREWAVDQAHQADLNPLETEFLDACVESERADAAAARRRTRGLQRLVAALVVLLVVASGLTGYSLWQRSEANTRHDIAVSRQLAVTAARLRESDPALANQLALVAYRVAATTEARSALLAGSTSPEVTRIVRPSRARQALAVSKDGTLLAGAGAMETDHEILLWATTDHAGPRRVGPALPTTGMVYAAAFSPDGQILATAGADKVVSLWSLRDREHPVPIGLPLTGPADAVQALEFSADGVLLAAGSRDNKVHLWNVGVAERPVAIGVAEGPAKSVNAVAFAPGGGMLAAGDSAGAVRLWDVSTGRAVPVGEPLVGASRVNAVTFNHDGTLLAAGSNDGAVQLWDVRDPARPTAGKPMVGQASAWVNALAFSADDRTIAAGGADSVVRIWDMSKRTVVSTLPHPDPVTTVAFRHGDRRLVTNAADGVARLWTLPGPVLATTEHPTTTVAFRSDGGLMATSAGDIRLWDTTDPGRPTQLPAVLRAPEPFDRIGGNVAISPDGRLLAAGTRSGNAVLLWDIGDPRDPKPVGPPLTGATGFIEQVQFSPSGTVLAAAGDDETVRLWDIADPAHAKPLPTLEPKLGIIFMVAFSPDGKLLAAATAHGQVPLWDMRDPDRPKLVGDPLVVSRTDVYSVAFSGTTLAAGTADGTVQLWDVGHDRPIRTGEPITGPDGRIHGLAFHPDGRTLAAGTGAGQVWLWDAGDRSRPQVKAVLDTGGSANWHVAFHPRGDVLTSAPGDIYLVDTEVDKVIDTVCGTTGDRITESEWTKYAQDVPYQPPC